MGMAHFIVATTQFGVASLCGQGFTTQEKEKMGIYGQICHECEQRAKSAWVTFK